MTVDEQIDAFGGNSELARKLGLRVPSTCANWRTLGAIPPGMYLRMKALGDELGVEVDASLFVEKSRQRPPARLAVG